MQPKAKKPKIKKGLSLMPGGLITLALTILIILSACHTGVSGMATRSGSGKIVSKSMALPEFHSIAFLGRGSLYLTQGPERGVVIETDDNLIDLYKAKVIDGVLRLGFKKNSLVTPTRVEVRLSAQQLRTITLNGSGRLVGMNTISGDELKLAINGSGDASLKTRVPRVWVRASGSGDANLHLDCEEIWVESSGSGRVRLSGKAARQSILLAGSGDYLAAGLINDDASIRIAGSSDARLWTKRLLEARLFGSGNLYYKGKPQLNSMLMGTGTIKTLY